MSLRNFCNRRTILYLLGMNVMALGILLSTRSLLGVAAISSVAYSYSKFLHISFGTANVILFFIFITIQALLLKSLSPKLLLQIPMACLVGCFIGLYDWIVPEINPPFALGLVLLVVSNILTGIGVYGMTKANLVLDPGNGIVDTLCRTLNRPFSYLRVRFDILLVTFTILSGLVIAHKVVGVGVGTLISAILIGKSVGFTGRLADRYVNHWLQVRR
ncbi:YczE/YyaS/YitT family protein [Millionella massiliensis]|uniref:YczE/YyaS/YitT family protein n=1 Tax=Millionella massiliensis TaxID=1871023 RepID=UPI0021CF05A7|nr:DUF6198 family protein [Millionella massiliensis]